MDERVYKDALVSQIRDAYGKVVYTYTTFLKMANRLSKRNEHIKNIQIVLSAISTVGLVSTIVVDNIWVKIISTIISATLLGITLYYKEFHLAEDIRQFTMGADELWLIREEYVSLLTDISVLPNEEVAKRRDELIIRLSVVYKKYPKTDSKAYKEARKALKDEEGQFFRDSEIDQMLPKHLRKELTS